jgi:hypothetical protein
MNRMAGTWFTGFQNPVNPVILSKARVEMVQTSVGTEPFNAIGCQPAPLHQAASGSSDHA